MNPKQTSYYLRTNNGTKNPSYLHETIESARIEAQRILRQTDAQRVEIMAICEVIEKVEIPVTKTALKTTASLFNDLPF
jgi:hypothetical protein